MSKRQWMMLFGVWVMVFPFLGFPPEWDTIITVVSGFFILIGAYRLRELSTVSKPESQVPYIEHRGETTSIQMHDMGPKDHITNSNLHQS
jgi:hypothetical protein